jgi:hypothetical protein
LYTEDDFNWRLSRIQKKKLLEYHGREFLITATPKVKSSGISRATSIEYDPWIVVIDVFFDRIFLV